MKTTIGNKIKQLRKAKNITQEQLAGILNISFQAISKWENDLATPDITMIPKIANYFKVSIDELFDYNLKQIEFEVTAICDEAFQYRESDPIKSAEILRNGLKEYPENDIILNNLLYVCNDRDEGIKIANKLISETNDDSVKYDSLRYLALAYKQNNDYESAVTAIEQIPELYFTKLQEAAFIYEGEAKHNTAEKQFWISFETVLQMCCKLYEYYRDEEKPDEGKRYLRQALKFIKVNEFSSKIYHFNSYVEYFNKLLLM